MSAKRKQQPPPRPQLNVRLSDQDKAIVDARAAKAGLTASEWARQIMISEDRCPTCGHRHAKA